MTGAPRMERVAVDERDAFRTAMRQLAGAVCVLTTGEGEARRGMTLTSVTSLSAEPPALLACIRRGSSSVEALLANRRFCVNVLAREQHGIASDFTGWTGLAGAARFRAGRWSRSPAGNPVLQDALANIDCELDAVIERHTHLILIGRVLSSQSTETAEPLLYLRGAYAALGGASIGA